MTYEQWEIAFEEARKEYRKALAVHTEVCSRPYHIQELVQASEAFTRAENAIELLWEMRENLE